MANSKYDYVRTYEEATNQVLLKDCYVIVRVDGVKFHSFSKEHLFDKPNDKRALDLMNESAKVVVKKYFPNIVCAYGQSDEYSFVFRKKMTCNNRRSSKLTSTIPSLFTASFVQNWSKYFPATPLKTLPTFDGRCVLYPNQDVLLDYLRWRQVDCHINNLYNTTFHALTGEYKRMTINDQNEFVISQLDRYAIPVYKPLSPQAAQQRLMNTVSSDKNEILFSEYGVNYNNELEQFKKGSFIVIGQKSLDEQREARELRKKERKQKDIEEIQVEMSVLHTDIIKERFWKENQYLLDYLAN